MCVSDWWVLVRERSRRHLYGEIGSEHGDSGSGSGNCAPANFWRVWRPSGVEGAVNLSKFYKSWLAPVKYHHSSCPLVVSF